MLDPVVEVRPTTGQVDDLLGEIRDELQPVALVTTLTKRMAEDLTDYLRRMRCGCAICTGDSLDRADRDHSGPAPRGIRRAGRGEPAQGGSGFTGGEPGGDPRCRQRLSAR